MTRKKRYDPPPRCVFCNDQRGTTEEHIIPRGLGGTLTIPNGTCMSCLEKIAPGESKLMNTNSLSARAHLKIRTKSKRVIRKLDVPVELKDDRITMERLTSDRHSGVIALHTFRQTGLESREPMLDELHCNFTLKKIYDGDDRLLVLPADKSVDFARMIAKIAHSYWIAEHGIDSVTHSLRDFIIGERTYGLNYFIGGSASTFPNDDLHSLHSGIATISGVRYAVVEISLFSLWMPATNYRVFVGEVAPWVR